MKVYTLSSDLRQPIAIDLMALPSEKFEVEVTGDVDLTVKNLAHDVSLETLDILKENSLHLKRFIRTHFEEGDDIGCLPSGLLAYDLSDGTAFDAADGRAFGVALTGEIVRKFCHELTQEPFQFPFGKIMVIDDVSPDDEIDLTAAMASLGAKDYLLLPSAFVDHPAFSQAKQYSIHCVPVKTLEDAVTPLVDSGVSFLHGKLNRVQSDIKSLLTEYDELSQQIAEFEKRAKVYIEGKSAFLETAKNRLVFLEDALPYLIAEIEAGKFATQEELKEKIEQLLNSFVPLTEGETRVEPFIEVSDDIYWTETEIEQVEKRTKTVLLRYFHNFVNRRDYTEDDERNWNRVRNLWKEKDHLLLSAHIICLEADHEETDDELTIGFSPFERFDAEVDKLTYTLKVREGLQNRIRNTESSPTYRAAMRGEGWLEMVSEELDKEMDAIKSQVQHLEAEIRNLTL